mmetsp:Transcript_59778/g.94959  ORF Transcript_59778/g.94959 Transcript_59778/m.94959 type:complete len:427 (-) Transcript_59778:140-1420(-)
MLLHILRSWSLLVTIWISICACISNVLTLAQRPKPLLHTREQARMWTLNLDKQHVPIHRKGTIVAYKTAYFGTVYVGTPELSAFTVLFDTGSGHVFLPSATCETDVCSKRHRYDRHPPEYVLDIDGSGHDSDSNTTQRTEVELLYGTGSVSGEFVKDRLCLGRVTANDKDGCTHLGLLSASDMTAEPFDYFSFDGVVGLGLDGLALRKDFSFFDSLSREGNLPEPCFSIFLARGNDSSSEIAFGGHNQDHVDSVFHWAPVASPEQGYWQVALGGVYIGDQPLSICEDGSCRAVLDSGTSLLGIPQEAISHLHRLLARPVEKSEMDCQSVPGPPIVFDFGNFQLQLGADDYSRPVPMMVKSRTNNATFAVCRASLLPVPVSVGEKGSNMFILGEPFLKRHYTKYDWQKHEIGFAMARQFQEEKQIFT